MKKYIHLHTKRAFTLLELIFVIIILGVVASIGSSIIANVYQNYLVQRATYRASLKTEIAAQQISNLLSYRLLNTTIARNPNNMSDNVLVTDPTNDTDITHTTLEWIGMDIDGFSARLMPPWNGFCDVNTSTQSNIFTPGSNLRLANAILKNLSNGEVSLEGSQYPAIFFRTAIYAKSGGTTTYYDVLNFNGSGPCLGLVSSNRSCISSVGWDGLDKEKLVYQYTGDTTGNKIIAEHYKLAWSAYSIRQIPKTKNLFDLKLCYNYQPWEGEGLSTNGCPGSESTIVTNVSVFKFAESGNTFRFKLCAMESIGEDYNITICKEKAIIL
jgi:prepilin-type N-terminal cleavage/methylation domain-containing protein